jgi:hypothetical protein
MTRCNCYQYEGVQCPRCEDYVPELVRDYAGRLVCGECEATPEDEEPSALAAEPGEGSKKSTGEYINELQARILQLASDGTYRRNKVLEAENAQLRAELEQMKGEGR